MNCVEVKNVSKRYKKNQALSAVTLEIPKGIIFGLLGVNGAGKTTLMKSILGLLKIYEGEILIEGESHQLAKARHKLCYLPERFSFFPYYTVAATLDFYADLYSIAPEERAERQALALSKLNISELATRRIKTLSKGQQQRVGLAAMVYSDAQVLFLDEPFSGLDPIAIKELKDLLHELKNQGRTVIMSTHILSEVELLCQHVAIIDGGKILQHGPTKTLTEGKTLEDHFYQLVKKGGSV